MIASYQFGPFLFDRTGGRLLRDGTPIDLSPRVLDLLLILLSHAGELVTKGALLESLWPKATVSDNALAQVVSDLRQALGEDPSAPHYIKTVARRGYRFIAPLVTADASTAVSPVLVDHTGRTTPPEAGRAPRPPGETVAVLDFTNASGDAELDWLSAGIADTLTGDLRALPNIRVLERRSIIDAAAAVGTSPQAVARETGADLLVVGSVHRTRNRLRMVARLLDAARNETLADVKVEGLIEQVFELQDQIVVEFARDLDVALKEGRGSRLGALETRTLEAYQAVTSGRRHLESLAVHELQDAANDFRRALELDEHYAAAHEGLAHAQFAMFETTRADNQTSAELLDEGTAHARRAIALDHDLADAYATLALLLAARHEPVEAATAAQHAVAMEPDHARLHVTRTRVAWGTARLVAADASLEQHPGLACVHLQVAKVHIARGDLERAEDSLRRGSTLRRRTQTGRDRFPPLGLHGLLGLVHLAQRDVDSALGDFERELAIADLKRCYGRECAMRAHFGRGLALLASQQPFDALTDLGAALALYPDHGPANLATAAALHALGDRTRAAHHLVAADDAIEVLAEHRPLEAALVRAQRLAVTGAPDAALDVLGRFVADAPLGASGWAIPIEPLLASLRTRPGFAGIARSLARRAE